MVIELAINSQADNDTGLTYGQIIESDGINAGQVIPYGPDMYRQALPIILKHGYAVASDPDGKNSKILKLQGGTYAHRYRYDGGVDMWFLNSYDCIFLYDCNEFSVELCRTALGEWTGKRLVLVGSKWERMIEYLDDIDGVECFYEPEPDDSRFTQLMEGYRCLHVIDGLPHQESMDRYNDGIMYYEEVMSFTYMFSDYRSLGSLNPDKKFFVIDGYYNKLGLFTIFSKIVTCAKYVKAKGMVPVVRLTMSGNSFYSDFEGDDIWSKFFNQPEGYTLEEVIHSANVYFSPGFYNGSVQSTIMENISEDAVLSWSCGEYNDAMIRYIEEKKESYLPYPDRTLEVLARGTDFVNTHLKNHPVYATKEMMADKIDELMSTWDGLEYIYIATEDLSYVEYFRNRFGDKVYFTDQQRYSTRPGQLLYDYHRSEPDRQTGFNLGAEYAASIALLAQCNSFLASGWCTGVSEAIRENQGNYRNKYIFDLGFNN